MQFSRDGDVAGGPATRRDLLHLGPPARQGGDHRGLLGRHVRPGLRVLPFAEAQDHRLLVHLRADDVQPLHQQGWCCICELSLRNEAPADARVALRRIAKVHHCEVGESRGWVDFEQLWACFDLVSIGRCPPKLHRFQTNLGWFGHASVADQLRASCFGCILGAAPEDQLKFDQPKLRSNTVDRESTLSYTPCCCPAPMLVVQPSSEGPEPFRRIGSGPLESSSRPTSAPERRDQRPSPSLARAHLRAKL